MLNFVPKHGVIYEARLYADPAFVQGSTGAIETKRFTSRSGMLRRYPALAGVFPGEVVVETNEPDWRSFVVYFEYHISTSVADTKQVDKFLSGANPCAKSQPAT